MKKILLSLAAIVFVGAAAAGATGAFFSDVETSTGNTFTAGALDLKVDDVQHYAGLVCTNAGNQEVPNYVWQLESASTTSARPELIGTTCDGTWTETDLGPSHKFFNFSDVKPGDQGENTISLHVDNNAYACMDIGTNENNENTLLVPEVNAGDNSSTTGELAQNIKLFGWLDNATTSGAVPGDNIWQAGETVLFQPTTLAVLSATTTLTLADGGTGSPLPGGSTSYFGLGWCAGTLTIGAPGSWSCNGAAMDNQSQTDSVVATIQFRAEQARNNPNFRCVPEVAPETGTVTLDKVVTFTSDQIAGVDVNDYTLHLVGPGGDHILVDETAFPGLTPGAYVVSEVYSNDPTGVVSTATFSGSCTEIGTTDTATLNVVAGVNPTCTITNSVSVLPPA
jgi:predicted ribosomally synthesized peptide with SipW-like signal peptide